MKKTVLFFLVLVLLGTMGVKGLVWAQGTVMQQLPKTAISPAPANQGVTRVASGVVLRNGQIFSGSGFSVAMTHYNNATQYILTFIPAFTTPPACVVTNRDVVGPIQAWYYDGTPKYLWVQPADNANRFSNGGFSFICVQQ